MSSSTRRNRVMMLLVHRSNVPVRDNDVRRVPGGARLSDFIEAELSFVTEIVNPVALSG